MSMCVGWYCWLIMISRARFLNCSDGLVTTMHLKVNVQNICVDIQRDLNSLINFLMDNMIVTHWACN